MIREAESRALLWLHRVTTLDDEDVHTIYRQDVDGSSSSQEELLTLRDKRARLVEYIEALQREDNHLQGRHQNRQRDGGHTCDVLHEVGHDGGQESDNHVSIGWLTWTHKGVAKTSADEVVLDVAACQ